ncbi:general odorant-binding protein 56d-like [Topomyia yanbarensis]|uniref:general odorant-binding protein 56d-like n=1 Tax=Topomyia yanbarensis TaxID=2498891 RepID=UPI00273BE993|nr:general odorant-binding protein 56d-like [Topomyia yanbarensis]
MTSLTLLYMSIIVLVVVNLPDSHQQDITKLPDIEGYKFHCIEASGITESSAKKLQSGEQIVTPDQQTKCYVQCFFQRLRLMNEKGEVQKDKLIKFLSKVLDESQAKAMVEKCDTRRTNPCDTAYDMFACYQKNKAKLF